MSYNKVTVTVTCVIKQAIAVTQAVTYFVMLCDYYNSYVSQISYSLVVILELNGVSEVQYKEVMIIDNE